jgi:pimeloyl-ACP methyl ester carboxylesterase
VAARDLYHEVAGAGRAVLLLHPGFADSRIWDPQWERYAQRFRVIRCDLRGFGRSSVDEMPITHAADVAALLDELRVQNAALVGSSLGGRVALEVAVARPDLVSALALVSAATPEALAAAPEMQAYTRELKDAIGKRDLEAAVEVNLRAWVDGPRRAPDKVDPKLRTRIATMQRDAFLNTRDVATFWREEPLVGNLSTKLAKITVPTLVVAGELDMDFIHAQARQFVSHIRGARIHTLPGAAHVPFAEQPDAFNEVIVPFIEANTALPEAKAPAAQSAATDS